MPNSNPLKVQIEQTVREAFDALMGPHLKALAYLETFMAAARSASLTDRPTPKGPKAARPSAAIAAKPGSAAKAKRASAAKQYVKLKTPTQRGDASKFAKGDRVTFNMGNAGKTQGVVTRVDARSATVWIKRDGSNQEFARPPVRLSKA